MKVEKLELTHLAPYLIHKLIMQTPKGDMQLTDLCSLDTRKAWFNTREASLGRYIPLINSSIVEQYNCKGFGFFLAEIKPYLRPLSQLTQEIEHNGERFVPMVELLNIRYASGAYDIIGLETVEHIHDLEVAWDKVRSSTARFFYNAEQMCFCLLERSAHQRVPFQYQMFQKLHEWKFDLYSLLESDLALELTNPLQTKQ